MTSLHKIFTPTGALIGACALALSAHPVQAHEQEDDEVIAPVRFASFNASLNRRYEGELREQLQGTDNLQARAVAEIIQRAQPDVLLINEFDYDAVGASAQLFQANYLSVGQNGADPIDYPYVYSAPVNTGVPSGYDLDNNAGVGGPNDAFGFGFYPGQYGMVVYSKYPIEYEDIRSFQHFLWRDMPGALLPDDPQTPAVNDWYSADELSVFRLSSKSHWDIPVKIGDERVHVLVSHPTPPVFDGAEDRNGRRNHDEIRLWADYIDEERSAYLYDDQGETGGLDEDEAFVIMGDQNADPFDGDSTEDAIAQLLNHPRINTRVAPQSEGGPDASQRQQGANTGHRGDPAFDTADFQDQPAPGNLRTDYVLPSAQTCILDAGVFWPTSTDPLYRLVGDYPFPSSDHRLVWVDVALCEED